LAPQQIVGSVTGVVGAAGGLGGFFPPLIMGATYQLLLPEYGLGLALLTVLAAGGLVFTLRIKAVSPDRPAR
jgi:NNP family nitrate/nitrite transporter-like MFS transporter